MRPIGDIIQRASCRSLVSSRRLRAEAVRFAIAGGTVAVASFATTITLAEGLGLPFQLSLAAGVLVSITLHFTLQRLFVWKSDGHFALELPQQIRRYLALAGFQYAVTALITLTLPDLINVSVTAVYVGTLIVIPILNFIIFRFRIFH